MNFISCARWVSRGVAEANPERVKLTNDELQKLLTSAKKEIEELKDEVDKDVKIKMEDDAQASGTDIYNFKDYDKGDGYRLIKKEYDSEEEDDIKIKPNDNLKDEVDKDVPMEDDAQASEADMYNFEDCDGEWDIEDAKDDGYKFKEEFDSEEEEDIKIKPNDNLIIVGHIDDDASALEIYVYNEDDGDLYVHHDILLTSIPLCVEWLNYEPTDSKPGNLVAVGSMSPVIEVWDLNVLNCLAPAYVLGKSSKKKVKKNHGHTDVVLDISWNRNYRHILASGSVDKTVLLWDLDTGKASTTFAGFTDKVQCLKWQPTDYHLLLTGSSDKTAKLFDCRLTETKHEWVFNDEIEKVAWAPWDSNKVYFGTNNGNIISYDIRHNEEPLWVVEAHEREICALELDINCPNLLFTCSADETVKIWNIESETPRLRSSKKFKLEELHCLELNPDCPFVACIGGTKKDNSFTVVNLRDKMLKNVTEIPVNTNAGPVLLESTQNAFQAFSIEGKKFKSKKKFGHKYKK